MPETTTIRAPRAGDQPPPVPNDRPGVWETVIADLPWMLDTTDATAAGKAIVAGIADDMRARDALGRARYGTPLQPHNGRDAVRDAYEEALDLTVYLRQALAEVLDGGSAVPLELLCDEYDIAMRLVVGLKLLIDARGKAAS